MKGRTQTTENDPIAARKQRVKDRVGDATEVTDLLLDLSRIDQEGVFINVVSGGMSALDTKLNLRVLGIEGVPPNLAMRIGSPSVGLLPDAERLALRAPVSEGYALLRKYGMSFMVSATFFGSGGHRWIPWMAFERFETLFERELKRLDDAKENAVSNWGSLHSRMEQSFRVLAVESRTKLLRQAASVPDDFVDQVVSALMEKVPSADFIADKMFLRRDVGILNFTSEVLGEREKTLAARKRVLEEHGEVMAREKVIAARADAARMEEAQRLAFIAAEQRREAEAKERIRSLKFEKAKSELEGQLSPLKEIGQQLAVVLNQTALDMLESIKKNGYTHARTAKRAIEMSEWFRLMNAENDEQMEALVARLGVLAAQEPSERSVIQFGDALNMIVEATRADAMAAAGSGRMSALEL